MLIDRLWQSLPGRFFFLCTKSATGKWREYPFTKDQFEKIGRFLEDNSHCDIYFCPHGFKTDRRKKDQSEMPNLLWADLDECDPRKCKPRPSIAIESSPGRYVGLWIVDRPITERLNQRLTYKIGADKGGWDLSQVLRVPGTINHKYESKPRTKIIWSDGPSYTIEEIEKAIGVESKQSHRMNGSYVDFDTVFARNRSYLRGHIGATLRDKPRKGDDRSDVFWKLVNEMIELKMDRNDIFNLLKGCAWNKFRDRSNEDECIWQQIEKAENSHDDEDENKRGGKRFSRERIEVKHVNGGPQLIFKSLDEVEERDIEWIYYPYLAKGELTILEGDPGLGKSYLAQVIASALCDGKKLPCVKHYEPMTGKVLYFDIENSSATVTKKRLLMNKTKHLERYIQCEEAFSIMDEDAVDEIHTWIEKNKPLLVVFDTINTYLGKADAFKGHEAQQTYAQFREIAKRFNCAVLTLRHLTKSSKERALYRGQGNIAFAGLARVVITVGTMPDDEEERVMSVTKINVARKPQALTFRIEEVQTLKEPDKSRLVWGQFVDMTSDEIVAARTPKKKDDSGEAAKKFVGEMLKKGPVDEKNILSQASSRAIDKKAIDRACEELGVVIKNGSWQLPVSGGRPAPSA